MKIFILHFTFLLFSINTLFASELSDDDSQWPTTTERSWPIETKKNCMPVKFVHLNFCVDSVDNIKVLRVDEPSPLNITFSVKGKLLSFIFYSNDELFSQKHIKDSLAEIGVFNIKDKFITMGVKSKGNKTHLFWQRQIRLNMASDYIHFSKNNFDAYWVVSNNKKFTDELNIVYKSKSGYELYNITGKMTAKDVNTLLASVF